MANPMQGPTTHRDWYDAEREAQKSAADQAEVEAAKRANEALLKAAEQEKRAAEVANAQQSQSGVA